MAKVFIGIGHGGGAPGAVANGLIEKDVNLVVGCTMKVELERHGVTVGISRLKDENDPLSEEIAECNTFKPDIAVECHANAGGGDGFEAYRQTGTRAEASHKLASSIEKQVVMIGQNSRGIKTRTVVQGNLWVDYYGWLRNVNCPAVLCEAAFLDNKTDMQIIDTIPEQEAFGVAYAKGVLDYLGITWKPVQSQQEASEVIYGVMKQVIALSDPEAAKKYAEGMRKQEPGAYWFVAEK